MILSLAEGALIVQACQSYADSLNLNHEAVCSMHNFSSISYLNFNILYKHGAIQCFKGLQNTLPV